MPQFGNAEWNKKGIGKKKITLGIFPILKSVWEVNPDLKNKFGSNKEDTKSGPRIKE